MEAWKETIARYCHNAGKTFFPALTNSLGIHSTLGDSPHNGINIEFHDYLPDSILLEIFHRLPVKSIFRLRCVSKHWQKLLSEPCFLRSYLSPFKDSLPWTLLLHSGQRFPRGNSKVSNVTSNHPEFKAPSFPCPFDTKQIHGLQPPKSYTIVATSNQLILCFTYLPNSPQFKYIVCNPFTKQWVALPLLFDHYIFGTGIISKPGSSVTHYKVVLIYDISSEFLHLNVFSSETGNWCVTKVLFPILNSFGFVTRFRRAISHNGRLHWIHYGLRVIVAYDPDGNTEECRLIKLPRHGEKNMIDGYNTMFDSCQGYLRYFEAASPLKLKSWSVWVLKDYDEGNWCLEHKADRTDMVCSADAIVLPQETYIPIAFNPIDSEIIYFWGEGYILSYNLRRKRLEDEFYQFPDVSILSWWRVYPILLPSSPKPISKPIWKLDGSYASLWQRFYEEEETNEVPFALSLD